MQKYLNFNHKTWLILFIFSIVLFAQEKKQNLFMPKFYRDDIRKPITINITPAEITPDRDYIFSNVKPDKYSGGYFYRYINPAKNSRLNSDFPVNKIWEVRWKAELKKNAFPWYLLIYDDRLIVQNEDGWQLFDQNGKLIKNGIKDEGNISIDQKQGLFFRNDFSGYLSLNDLETGDRKFLIYPFMGKGYDRSILYCDKNNFTSIGFSIPTMTHKRADTTPDITLLETIDMNNQSDIDSDKILYSAFQKNKLICQANPVKVASLNNEIVLATEDNLIYIDKELNIKSIFTDRFIPLQISLDESMNVYMISEIKQENMQDLYYLKVISPAGKLIYETKLFNAGNNFYYPPIIGYNHFVSILNADNTMTEINIKGKTLWHIYLNENSPGANITANNFLLTSEGNILSAIDQESNRKFIFEFKNETLCTPPILTTENKIYVASKNFLFCLIPKN